jgi:hypothetical protein
MSEWGSLVALFWALYLADAVGGGRRERLWLTSWRGGYTLGFWPRRRAGRRADAARLTQARWHLAPLAPWAWSLSLDDAPVGLTAQGISNRAEVSTARPAPMPDTPRAVRWEDLGKVEVRSGFLWVAGKKFTPCSEALDKGGLRTLAERLAVEAPAAREKEIAAWHARRFSVTRARRRLAVGLRRTRTLAWVNTLQVAGWGALSAGLLSEAFNPGSPTRLGFLAPWWLLVFWLLAAHVWAVTEAWRVHGRLHPTRGEERAGLIFSALLLPAQALRLRVLLLRPLAKEMAPLAGVLALGTPTSARAAAAATWRDAVYPSRPAELPSFFIRLGGEAIALALPAVERALGDATAAGLAGVTPAELLAPPARRGRGVCAYCPRCGDEFVRADGVCPHGVALRSLAPSQV